jgi:AhpD family alkylhydroperoxidase
MLVVTSVNQCRYCAVFHTRAAQLSGLMPGEIALLLGGELQHAPEFELPALLYARSWAEADGAPDCALSTHLVVRYGSDLAAGIELMLRAIQIGNLLGNTADYLLFWISGGRLGQHKEHG